MEQRSNFFRFIFKPNKWKADERLPRPPSSVCCKSVWPVWPKIFHWVPFYPFGRNFSIGSLFTCLGEIFPSGPFYQFGRYFSTGSFLPVWAIFFHRVLFTSLGGIFGIAMECRTSNYRPSTCRQYRCTYIHVTVTYVHKCYICTYMLLKIFFCAIFFHKQSIRKNKRKICCAHFGSIL
jgi:hypothetical protein